MTFSFLTESNLKKAFEDAESAARPHFQPLAEIERLSRGLPGRIPKGKPRVTDGTLAGVNRETAKRIIQQLPTGKVRVKKLPDLEPYVNAVLSDEILKNANAGGTPYAKSKKAIKDTGRNGASVAYCFYNRRGDKFTADFRRVYVKDLYLEKGKVSEFDANYMFMVGWFTHSDIEALIYEQKKLDKSQRTWDIKLLQELLDGGDAGKDAENKSSEESKKTSEDNGFFKLVSCFQIGIGAKFYTYSPRLNKVLQTWTNPDPRGIIPIHILVPEEDDATPYGEPLLAISAGKQNLLDFDMQMYQYGRGLLYSPPVKKWGNVPNSAIKLVPDAVIPMGANKDQGTDIEPVDFSNSAISDYRNNTGFIKTQIYNEQGATSDSSISASVGAPGYSKTSRGVEQQQTRLGISDNDLRKAYEAWFGRICETLLNIHFAESNGLKELDLEVSTIKRHKLDAGYVMDYDQDFGPITFVVDASTSEASDNQKENEQLTGLLEITSKFGGLRPDRQMCIINQIIQNSGVDDSENLKYTDEEIEQAKAQAEMQQQMAMQKMRQAQMQTQMPQTPQQPALPAEAQEPIEGEVVQPSVNEDEAQTIQMLSERGFDNEVIADALTMMREGYSDEEVMQVLAGGVA